MRSNGIAKSLRGEFEELTEEDCLELLRSKGLGRAAYQDDAGPVVLPVNYVVDAATILFRTSPYSPLAQHLQHMQGSQAAFEVDDIDNGTDAGWSVLVRGPANCVETADLPAAAERPTSWRDRESTQSLHVRITPRIITGRRLEPHYQAGRRQA